MSEHGIPRPVTADEFRWLDVDVMSKTFLGSWRGSVCYALEVEGTVPENYVLGDLRSWLGRVEPGMFYLAGRGEANRRLGARPSVLRSLWRVD